MDQQGHQGGSLGDFAAGLAAPWQGLVFIAARPSTWVLAIVPALLAGVLFVVFGGLFIHVSLAWLDSRLPAPADSANHVFPWFFHWLFAVLLIAISLVLAVLPAFTLASPLAARPLEGLVRAHDAEAGVVAYPPVAWTTSAARALGSGLLGVVVGGVTTLLLGASSALVPALAVILHPLGIVVGGWVIAWNLIDYPLGLRAMNLVIRLRWMQDNLALVTGFGLSASVFLFVPGVGLLLLPAGVVGAAIVAVRGERERL